MQLLKYRSIRRSIGVYDVAPEYKTGVGAECTSSVIFTRQPESAAATIPLFLQLSYLFWLDCFGLLNRGEGCFCQGDKGVRCGFWLCMLFWIKVVFGGLWLCFRL